MYLGRASHRKNTMVSYHDTISLNNFDDTRSQTLYQDEKRKIMANEKNDLEQAREDSSLDFQSIAVTHSPYT